MPPSHSQSTCINTLWFQLLDTEILKTSVAQNPGENLEMLCDIHVHAHIHTRVALSTNRACGCLGLTFLEPGTPWEICKLCSGTLCFPNNWIGEQENDLLPAYFFQPGNGTIMGNDSWHLGSLIFFLSILVVSLPVICRYLQHILLS